MFRSRLGRKRLALVSGVGLVLLVLAACTTGGAAVPAAAPTGAATTSPAPAAPSTAASAPTESSSGGGRGDYDYGNPGATSSEASLAPGSSTVAVNVASGPVGAYLTGVGGLTLYTFKLDSANTSTCDGGCAQTWRPLTIQTGTELEAGDGVEGKLTTFPRADGALQVAYSGAPLYYFANDSAPGDTNGQGIGDVWFVAKP